MTHDDSLLTLADLVTFAVLEQDAYLDDLSEHLRNAQRLRVERHQRWPLLREKFTLT